MRFGVQFFPDVKPDEKSGEAYFREALDLTEEADRLGFSHIRIVEHYFHFYGGYNPNPILVLAAAAPRTPRAPARHRRGITGVQQPAEARWRDRNARRAERRPARCRLRARLSAARVPPLRRIARRVGSAVSRGDRAGRSITAAGERQPSRPLSHDREHDLAAAADTAAATALLCRRAEHAGIVRVRRTHGLFGHGDRLCRREDAAPARRLP